jgi:glycosyltransferase involved in cell wall biosynthesis
MLLSVVIATHKRASFLKECLHSLSIQTISSFEIILAHSGENDGTLELKKEYRGNHPITYLICKEKGAASQRNEGVQHSKGEWIVFLDDDVLLRPDFLEEIVTAIESHPDAGGISGSIENQFYEEPGTLKKILLRMIGISPSSSLAGRVKGPALNFLPERKGTTFEVIDWMPTCVCAYSKKTFEEAGGFPFYFKDYSFGEDLFISVKIRNQKPLILTRKAVLYHNDQGGKNHQDWKKIALMQMCNRLYIIKHAMGKEILLNRFKLYFWYSINVTIELVKGKKSLKNFFAGIIGYTEGLFTRIP